MREWLDELASSAPAPGGGAAAAMNAAIGAALVSMVCNLTIGKPKYASHEQVMTASLASSDALRARALELAEEDAVAFNQVVAAYRLPKDTDEERRQRLVLIQAALEKAAEVPLQTAALAADVIGLARQIMDGANVNVLSDVAVAASSAKAALTAAAINVEVNLAAMRAPAAHLATALAGHVAAAAEADAIIEAVRDRINR